MEFKYSNIGNRKPFFLIAGNCVVESRESAIETAGRLKEITDTLCIPFHPEFTSNPRDGHPLFKSFVEACVTKKEGV